MARAGSEDVIVLGQRRRGRLEAIVAKASAPRRLVLRAKIVLAAWRGASNAAIARDLDICEDTVRTWRGRFSKLRRQAFSPRCTALTEPTAARPRAR